MSSLPEDTHWAVTEFAEADPDDIDKRHRRKQLPISQKWLTSLVAVGEARAE